MADNLTRNVGEEPAKAGVHIYGELCWGHSSFTTEDNGCRVTMGGRNI